MLNGTLDFDVTVANIPCGPGSTYTQTTYSNFSFGGQAISGQQVVAQGYSEYNCPNYTQPTTLPLILPNTNPVTGYYGPTVQAGECVFDFSQGNGNASCPTLSLSSQGPAYQVVSILYAPPGNRSTAGLVSGVTGGTTTTIGNNFTYAQTISNTFGIPGLLTLGGYYGSATSTNSSTEFISTWQDAVGVFNNTSSSTTLNSTQSDAIDHGRDDIAIWLNPLVTIVTDEGTNQQISYEMSSAPTQGTSTLYADVLIVPAVYMMPNASGVTTVPASVLNQQQIAGTGTGTNNFYAPGLASICKNLNKTEYSSHLCTLQDQCGCTPADFAQIVAQDALLNYNTTNFTSNPVAGSVAPTSVDVSGSTCTATNPIHTYPNYAVPDCRYVIIPPPLSSSSTSPYDLQLSGSNGSTGQQTISDSTILTSGLSNSYTTGITIGASTPVYGQKVTDQWTWQNFESTGQTNGRLNQTNVQLETTTSGCQETVALYEDTIYHTLVFQTPSDPSQTGCAP